MLKSTCSILRKNISECSYVHQLKKFSTVQTAKQTTDSNSDNLEDLCSIRLKNREKLPQRLPFLKNLFLGKFDHELLTYPQMKKEDVDELENYSNILEKCLSSENIKDFKEFLTKLRIYRCIGLKCNVNSGGRDLNTSEQCKFNEILLSERYKYHLIHNEISISVLLKFGTDEQKEKYLKKLMTGEISSSIAISDYFSKDHQLSEVTATIKDDYKNYLLHGEKRFVINGDADLFIIFSKMAESVKDSVQELDITAFLVDRTSDLKVDKISAKSPSLENLSDISFNRTEVSVNNILGGEREGRKVLSEIIMEYNLSSSVIGLNIMKKLLKCLIQDCLNKSKPGEEIYNTEAIAAKLNEISKYIYVVESMVYFTSGLLSSYENQDCELEMLATRILSAELALRATKINFSLLGIPCMETSHFCQELHEEALTLYSSYENENMTRLLIALLGLQYAGQKSGETVKKLRNPLFYGTFMLKKLWEDRHQRYNKPKLTLELKNYLHLSCSSSADSLEHSVLRLKYLTEVLFTRHGIEILNKHSQLNHLVNIVLQIYSMTACLTRASRSYCIGLKNSESEVFMADMICKEGYDVIAANEKEILYSYDASDITVKPLSTNLFIDKEYYFSHPLSRNF